jgi:hypothetical protein
MAGGSNREHMRRRGEKISKCIQTEELNLLSNSRVQQLESIRQQHASLTRRVKPVLPAPNAAAIRTAD